MCRGVDLAMQVEIWSDVVCPWCYIGKRRLERALERFEHRDDVEVVWRAFELDRHAPQVRDGDYVDHLSAKYRVAPPEAQRMIDQMTEAGAGEGLELRFDVARPGNTFDAHRLLSLAAERGLQGQLQERLFAATFHEGEPVGDRGALARLAAEVGLDRDEAREVLDTGARSDDVRADEHLAEKIGIDAVPFFVFDRAYAVAGAQQPDVLLEALEKAWHDAGTPDDGHGHDHRGAACEEGSCGR